MAKGSMLKNTIIYSIGEIFPKLISFVLLPVFTIYLSAADYGIISYTNSVMFFLFVISSLSLNTYLLRGYYECETDDERKRMVGGVFMTILMVNIAILILGYLLGPAIVRYTHLKIPFFPFFSLLLVNNFCEALSIVPLVVYRVKENAVGYVFVNVMRALLLFIVTYILIVHYKWGIMGNFYGRVFVNAFFIVIYLWVILKHSILNINFKAIRKSLEFSLPLIPGAIGYLLMSMSDRIILERYVSLSDIGIYSVAYTLAYSLSIVIQSGYRSFEPEIYRKFNDPDFGTFVDRIHRMYMFVVLFLAVVLAMFSRDILLIMTKGNFVLGYRLIPLILIGVVATAENAILGAIVISEKNTKLSGFATVIGGSMSIIFNLCLIPIYGIYAAATASAIAYVLENIIIFSRMKFRNKAVKSDLTSIIYFMILSAGVIYFFGRSEVNLVTLTMKVTLTIISFFVLMFIYGLQINTFKAFLLSFKKK